MLRAFGASGLDMGAKRAVQAASAPLRCGFDISQGGVFPVIDGYRGRFAPSPTGRLHFGSLVAALGSWLFARASRGRWLLRIEDLDHERQVAGAAQDIVATLTALGMTADEPVLVQSARVDRYAAALRQLEASGHAYRCWCSRTDLQSRGGIHPSTCVSPPADRAPAWRLRVESAEIAFDDLICGHLRQSLAREVGDFVLWRADGLCAYQLAVVVDDAAQGITDVVRGADLLDSTPRQILLQRLLGLPHPRYAHLPLALDAQGRKLSKQDAARPVDGQAPMPALRAALDFLGQPPRHETTVRDLLDAAVDAFDSARIARSVMPHCGSA